MLKWDNEPQLVSYPDALAYMDSYVKKIMFQKAPDKIWSLEHPSLYTQGTNPLAIQDIKDPSRNLPFPLYPAGRGGRLTYHGPGQQILYCMIDLKRLYSTPSLHLYLSTLQQWVMNVLKDLNILGFSDSRSPGIWVTDPVNRQNHLKIASFGIRLRRWVSFHGLSLNVCPNLSHFSAIRPCGETKGVTSLESLGINVSKEALLLLFQKHCPFGQPLKHKTC